VAVVFYQIGFALLMRRMLAYEIFYFSRVIKTSSSFKTLNGDVS